LFPDDDEEVDEDLTSSNARKGNLDTPMTSLILCPSAECTLVPKHATAALPPPPPPSFSPLFAFSNRSNRGWQR
jgi:hypothetical protein